MPADIKKQMVEQLRALKSKGLNVEFYDVEELLTEPEPEPEQPEQT